MISSTVTGNLGQDAELKYVNNDAVLSFSVASRRYDSKSKQETTDWVRVSFWGKRAEGVSKYLTKGSRVAVRGALYVRPFESQGATKFSIELRADDVELMGGGQDSTPQRSSAGTHREVKASDIDDGIPF